MPKPSSSSQSSQKQQKQQQLGKKKRLHEEIEQESSSDAEDEEVAAAAAVEDANDSSDDAALREIEELAEEPTQTNSVIDKTTTYAALGLHPQLCKTCERLGYKHPTRIQTETLRAALPLQQSDDDNKSSTSNRPKDIIGIAETGSGKTAAFVLPILHHLLSAPVRPSPGSALVLTPTRELAAQIKEHFDALGSDIGLKTVLLVGGSDFFQQQLEIKRVEAHVIIGTPGRVEQHLRETSDFKLFNLKFLVLDEADKMLSKGGFEDGLEQVLARSDKTKRTTYLFSATMTKNVEKLQKAQMRSPVLVKIAASKYSTVASLTQEYLFVPEKFKEVYLSYVLNENPGKRIVIFCSQNATCMTLTLMLRSLGFQAVPLAGHMKESDRMHCLNKFKSGSKPILIATDVASRGLDIPLVEMVIIFDIPVHSKEYIHRVGRTARAGKKGQAVTFVTQYDLEYFQKIEKLIGKKMNEYKIVKEDAMTLVNVVGEALQLAKDKVKQKEKMFLQNGSGGGGAAGSAGAEDEEEVIYDAVKSLAKKREAKAHQGAGSGSAAGGAGAVEKMARGKSAMIADEKKKFKPNKKQRTGKK